MGALSGRAKPNGFHIALHIPPLGDGGGMLASYTTDDPDKEESDLEPFVVIGA